MKLTTFVVAILSVTLIAFECAAQSPGGKAKGKAGKAAAGQRGQRGERTKGSRGQKPGSGQQRDPAEMAAKMMKEFDKDGDNKLSTRELTAMLVSMRDRRGNGGKSAAGSAQNQKPGQAGKSKGKSKGKGKSRQGSSDAPAGGQKPKRPGSE